MSGQVTISKMSVMLRERLFAHLRGEEVRSDGETARVYLEANGPFSVVNLKPAVAGLSIIPGERSLKGDDAL
jgi:hypothetical protein